MSTKKTPPALYTALSFALVVSIFMLISLGGLVRNAGAGLSCPDWPLCFGKVVPPMDVRVFLEWFHRLIAGFVSVFLLALSVYAFFVPYLRARVSKYCVAALVLLAFQIVLGGLTVIGLLSPKWVTSHLAVGLAFYGTLVLLFMELATWKSSPLQQCSGLRKLAAATVLVVYLQAILGGLVSSNYAGLACPDFPTCDGLWFPPFEGLVRFQFLHRVGALLATVAVLSLFVAVYRASSGVKARLHLSDYGVSALWLLPVMLTLQVTLGIVAVLWQLPLPVSVAHLASAALLLGATLVVWYELGRR